MGAALEALRTRVELVAVELEIHLIGLARSLVWALASILCGLIAALWNSHRVLGLLAGATTFVVLALACALIGVRLFQRRPGILEYSVEQLERDQRRAGPPCADSRTSRRAADC